MALILENIGEMYKGVSRQAQDNRLDGQVQESINMMHSVEKGVTRRNPLELINSNADFVSEVGYLHSYVRGDGVEEYIINISKDGIDIVDSDGIKMVVNYDSGFDMSWFDTKGDKAIEAFKAITVGDTTFIVNRMNICSMTSVRSGVEDSHLKNPFYWIKRSFDNGSNTGYTYVLNGVSKNATKTTDASSSLASSLNSANSGGVGWTSRGSVVIGLGKSTRFDWSDSFGSQASEGFNGVARKIEDLPRTLSDADTIADTDFRLEIKGDSSNKFNVYWMKYKSGEWLESRKPYNYNTIDKTTMPIRLLREADGTFTVYYIDYDERLKGDENTASEPSFIGQNITSMFFFKNRLCFLAGENVIMSETGSYYNFFPTTVRDILDSDPIDVAVDSVDVASLQNAVTFNNSVILFSSNGQFSLQSEKVLSPIDVSITSTTNYNSAVAITPIALGNSIFFPSETVSGTSLREYYVDSSGQSNIAIDVSAHVEGYIPKGLISLEGNTNNNTIFSLSSEDDKTVYIYKYFNDGQTRIQTAWFKWVFTKSIKGITLLDKYLYLLQEDDGNTLLSKVDITAGELNTVYKDYGTDIFESSVTLSQLIVKDEQGASIKDSRSPLIYKTFKMTSVGDSVYKVRVHHKIRDRVVEKFALRDNKFLVKGKSTEVELTILSVEDKPLEFHKYAMEANYNLRSQII